MTEKAAKPFNPNEHIQKIQGKDYLPVRWRLVWFRQETGTTAGYVTVELEYDRQAGFAKYFCVAWDGADDTWRQIEVNGMKLSVCGRVATGEGSETRSDFPDYAEKAATKSVGRAMAGLGFGTQFAEEMNEGTRFADSPTERGNFARASEKNGATSEEPKPTTLGLLKGAMLKRDIKTTNAQEKYILDILGADVNVAEGLSPEQLDTVWGKLQSVPRVR